MACLVLQETLHENGVGVMEYKQNRLGIGQNLARETDGCRFAVNEVTCMGHRFDSYTFHQFQLLGHTLPTKAHTKDVWGSRNKSWAMTINRPAIYMGVW